MWSLEIPYYYEFSLQEFNFANWFLNRDCIYIYDKTIHRICQSRFLKKKNIYSNLIDSWKQIFTYNVSQFWISIFDWNYYIFCNSYSSFNSVKRNLPSTVQTHLYIILNKNTTIGNNITVKKSKKRANKRKDKRIHKRDCYLQKIFEKLIGKCIWEISMIWAC